MESPSHPFHSRKLSNATTFSNKNAYATVFSGHRRNFAGPSAVDVQDYREIFRTSQTSSIPVLDLSISSLAEQSDGLSFKFRDSNPDFSEIFGGFRDEQVAVCYDKLFGLDKFRVGFRAPSSRTPTSQDSSDLSDQSSDVLKQFSMSYNKINPKSKDGLDGAKHVTQVPAVTGFTCFIDEPVLGGEKESPPVVDPVESVSEVSKSRRFDTGFNLHPSNAGNYGKDTKRSVNLEAFRTDFDEEVDVNSAASALKKAIEKAQESIRIAKESVGRKKHGLRSVSNKKFKNSLKLEGGEQKCRDEDSSQAFQDVGRNGIHGEKLYVAKKFLEEIHEKISESTKSSKLGDDSVLYNASQVISETDSRFLDSSGKDESATLCSEEIGTETSKIHVSDEHQTHNTFVGENKARIKASKPTIEVLESESVMEELELRESNNEVRLNDAHELVEEINNLNVSKEGEDFDQNDSQNRSNEEQVDVVEQEDSEDAASEKHEEVEEASEALFDDFSESDAKDSVQTGDEKMEESEVNLHDDCETKQEDNQEDLDQSSDLEFDLKSLDENIIIKETDDIDGVHVASSNLDTNGINVETNQDFDDVAEVSSESNAEAISEESEVKSEENNEKPEIEITNEVKDSQEAECRNKEDETEEPRPSKVSGKDRFKRINEEAAAREREWERNRLAVERAIREARERAFAEARERAERERAAVEKATEEVRQRMMAEAHEKVAKASVTNKSSDKTSARSKLKAERAAVERATSEARQRALEKAISQKTAFDLNRSESALRTKAKLEKQNRIMERAAKALAEKEKRDRLAQKEQAERHRLAENLDADIKRWANGKEGNLRALLSTLQYILGPESGWQPVSLTEIVSSSAVKKAYRKATLCVHPDKLQQRGATVQHKYICEKVFDLLKAAWNRFNSEER